MKPDERQQGGSNADAPRANQKNAQQPADRSGGSGQKQIGGERQGGERHGGEREGDDNRRDSSDRGSSQH